MKQITKHNDESELHVPPFSSLPCSVVSCCIVVCGKLHSLPPLLQTHSTRSQCQGQCSIHPIQSNEPSALQNICPTCTLPRHKCTAVRGRPTNGVRWFQRIVVHQIVCPQCKRKIIDQLVHVRRWIGIRPGKYFIFF